MEVRRATKIAEKMAVRLEVVRGDTQSVSPESPVSSSTPPKRRIAETAMHGTSPAKNSTSVTTAANSTPSCVAESPRTGTSPLTLREHTTKIVDIDTFSTVHVPEKQRGKASESRRCLGKELEVFNMADGDEAVAPLLSGATTDRVEDDMTTPSSRVSRRESTSTFTTMTNASSMNEHEEQGDAWAIEDWCSQSSGSSHTSPCGAAHTLDKTHREVADAVLSELQIDLQAQVQKALNQMNTWLTEEITFASTNFRNDMEQAMELVLTSWRKEFLEVQSNQCETDRRLDALRTTLEERNGEAAPATWKTECLSLKTCHAELECKLQSLQTSLEEQLHAVKRSCEDVKRSVQPSMQAELQSSHTELDCKIKLLQDNFEEHIQSVKRELEDNSRCTQPCTLHDLHNSHADLDFKIKALQTSMEEQIQSSRRLCEDSSNWIQQRTATESQPSSKVMEARVVAEERKWRLKLDQIQDSLAQHLQRIEALDSQSSHLMRKSASNDIGLDKVSSTVRELDSRVVKITKEDATLKESFERRIRQMELTNLSGKVVEIETLATELARKSETTEAKLADHNLQNENFQKRLSQIELLNLAQQIADLDTAAKDATTRVDCVELKLTTDVAQHQQKIEGFQSILDGQLARIDSLGKQGGDLAEKLAVLAGSSEEHNASLQRLETQCAADKNDINDMRTRVDKCSERLESLEDEVGDLEESVIAHNHRVEDQLKGFPLEFRAQLQTTEESFNKIFQDLSDEFNHSTTELSVALGSKASRSDIQCTQEAVSTWVEDARRSHQLSLEALADSMQQVQASSLQQSIEIKRHQEYMKELSAYINEGVEREQCVNDVILHIVEEDHPDLMVLIEKRLQQTSRSSWSSWWK